MIEFHFLHWEVTGVFISGIENPIINSVTFLFWVSIYPLINNGLEFWCVGINYAARRLKWLITSIRTTNRCQWADIWRYFLFYFDSNMINNKLKGLDCLLVLVHIDIRFTSAESEQPETWTYNYRSMPESSTVVYRLINNSIFVHCLYRQKHRSCKNSLLTWTHF